MLYIKINDKMAYKFVFLAYQHCRKLELGVNSPTPNLQSWLVLYIHINPDGVLCHFAFRYDDADGLLGAGGEFASWRRSLSTIHQEVHQPCGKTDFQHTQSLKLHSLLCFIISTERYSQKNHFVKM